MSDAAAAALRSLIASGAPSAHDADELNALSQANSNAANVLRAAAESAHVAAREANIVRQEYTAFLPHIERVGEIDAAVGELEQAVLQLDDYTRRLEEKFKRVAAQRREATRLAARAQQSHLQAQQS